VKYCGEAPWVTVVCLCPAFAAAILASSSWRLQKDKNLFNGRKILVASLRNRLGILVLSD
jgi:hypothetical protein